MLNPMQALISVMYNKIQNVCTTSLNQTIYSPLSA